MTKTYNFYKSNNTNTGSFHTNSTNYSKIIDDIILGDVIKKNKYLFDYDDDYTFTSSNSPIILSGSNLKVDDDFIKATNFLANYKKYKKIYKIPYELGKMYTLSDGTPIIFYDDELQIGFDTFKYSNFSNFSFLNGLTTKTKKTIINIYTFGASNIEINIH
jgi:hypothetical protein